MQQTTNKTILANIGTVASTLNMSLTHQHIILFNSVRFYLCIHVVLQISQSKDRHTDMNYKNTNFFFASKILETEVYLIRQSCVHLKNHAITPRQHERKERTETPKHRWQSTTMGRKSTTNAAPLAGAKRSNRISSYYQSSSGPKGREIKKEMIAGATPPPKQTRKNGTTPDTTGTAKMSGLQSKKKSSNDSNNNKDDEVDGEDIYSVPKEDQSINNEDHAGTTVPMDMMPANYEEDFPRLDKPEGKVSNIQTTTIKDTKVNQQDSPEAIEADGERLIKSGISTKLQETTHPQPHEDGSVITKEKATNVSGDNKATPPTAKATKKVKIQQTLPVVLKRKFEYRVLVSFKVKQQQQTEYESGIQS